jgi:hypothetical protein
MAYFINRSHNAALLERIAVLSPLAHELVVEDTAKIAVVKLEEHWMDDNNWEVYLPEGRYRLCLATRGIENVGVVSAPKRASLESGRHRVGLERTLEKGVWRISVSLDGAEMLVAEEPENWKGRGSQSSGPSNVTEQFSLDTPAVLLRLRFTEPFGGGSPDDSAAPTDGILLWIEADPMIARSGGAPG